MKNIIFAIVIATSMMVQNSLAQTNADSLLNDVFTSYISLKNSLATKDGSTSKDLASILFKTIDKLPAEKLSANRNKIWMDYAQKLSYDSEHIKSTDDIEHQREHFVNLSANMYKMMKALKINTTDLYYQFCPMANDGKGAYWISEKSIISNPYFGKKMPTCGSTKDTIKAK